MKLVPDAIHAINVVRRSDSTPVPGIHRRQALSDGRQRRTVGCAEPTQFSLEVAPAPRLTIEVDRHDRLDLIVAMAEGLDPTAGQPYGSRSPRTKD
jgi:hypothetical protein